MTEQECANNLDNLHKKIVRNYEIASKVTEKEVMSLVRAKKLLEELEQIKALQDDYWKLNEMCKDYSALGTVEELRELKEKLDKIKYVINEKHYANAEECDYGNYYKCEKSLMIEDIEHILND